MGLGLNLGLHPGLNLGLGLGIGLGQGLFGIQEEAVDDHAIWIDGPI